MAASRGADGPCLSRIIREHEKWDRHPACLARLTGWKPIPRAHEYSGLSDVGRTGGNSSVLSFIE